MRYSHLLLACAVAAVFIGAAGLCAADAKPAAAAGDDMAALFDKLDANHDGQLTSDEVPREKRGLFERLLRRAGKAADGKLAREEFIAQLKGAKPEAASDTPAKPSAGDSTTKPAVPPNPAGPLANLPQINPERMFERLSKGTGKLTLDDVPEPRRPLMRRIFAEAGKPDGGSLTKDEFIKAIKAVIAKRAAAGLRPLTRPAGGEKPSTDSKSNGDNKSTH